MNTPGKLQDRADASEKRGVFMQDDENTYLMRPIDMHGNKFFGSWSRVATLTKSLNWEIQEKYTNDYRASLNAKLQMNALPECFDYCV